MWLFGAIIGRYRRRVAFLAAIGVATLLYGLVGQSTRPELDAWYWPSVCAAIGFVITRLAVSAVIARLVGGVRRRLH
ncbi:hypothetical protein LPB41_22100 [Thalassospira sp. MA62]|nr:hypothetical protein [Thalassospira sp. MA62]